MLRSADNTVSISTFGSDEYENFVISVYGYNTIDHPFQFEIVPLGTVIWKDEDGNILEKDENVPQGSKPSFDGDYSRESESPDDYYYVTKWFEEYNGTIGTDPYDVSGLDDVSFENGQKVYWGKFFKIKYLKPGVTFFKLDGIDTGDSYARPDDDDPAYQYNGHRIVRNVNLLYQYGNSFSYCAELTSSDGSFTSYNYKSYSEILGEKVAWKCTGGDGTLDAPYTFDYVPCADVTWKLDDDTVIDTTLAELGDVPTHADPTGEGDAQFAGWTSSSGDFYAKGTDLPAVTGDETYTATFANGYSWIDESGASHTLTYGTDGSYPTATIDGTTITFNQEWTSTDSLPTSSGSYYLANDVAYPDHEWTISTDHDVKIFLNGKTITHAAGTSRFLVQDEWTCGTVSIFGDGTITTNNGNESFDYMDTGTFNMYGGTITGFNKAFDLNGNQSHMVYLNLYGGTITGNHAGDGGGVSVSNGSEFRMFGGSIENNTADGVGGGVAVFAPSWYGRTQFIMTGGSIKNNSAENGGGIFCKADTGDFCMRGTVDISGNTATENGGDIYLEEDKKLTVTGALNPASPIAVSRAEAGEFTKGCSANNVDPTVIFISDDAGLVVEKSDAGEGVLKALTWTATYLAGEGSGTIAAREVQRGKSFTLPTGGLTAPEGMMLAGWLSSADDQVYRIGEEGTLTGDTTFTAQWEPGIRYLFDFEDGKPVDWQAGTGWYLKTDGGDGGKQFPAHSGSQNMTYYVANYDNSGDLLTSAFDLSKAETAQFSFWYTNRSWIGDTDQLAVSYRVGNGEWEKLFETSGNHESWTNEVITLPAEALAENVRFCFKAIGNYGYGIALDDVDITATIASKKLFTGHDISLNADIGVNFFINSAYADFAGAETATVKFTWDDGNYTKEVNLKELEKDGNGYYKATCDVVAAMMAHKIHAAVYVDGAALDQTDDYSVQEYADKIFKNPEMYDTKEKPAELKALAKALLNYGSMAQTVFDDYLKEKPALANTNVGAWSSDEYAAVTADMIASKINGSASDLNDVAAQLGAKYFTNSLIYLSKNALRIYFTPTSYPGDMPNADAYDGNQSNYYYYVEHKGIAAAELDNQQTFTVGGTTFTFSALDYAKTVVGNNKMAETQKNLARSLFLYNQAANAYFD